MNKAPFPTARKRFPRTCIAIYAFTALSALLYLAFRLLPAFADWFNRYVSTWGRRALAAVTSWIPFSVAELLLLLIPLFIGLLIYIGIRHYCDSNRSAWIYVGILGSILCVVGILFVWNFAPGYSATPLDKKLELERKKSSADELYRTAEQLSAEIAELTDQITFLEDGSSLMPYSHDEMNAKLLEGYEQFCQKYDFIDTFSSRVKPVMLSEPMSYTHITGVYTFFTGEANLNINFPDYTLPYTAAHELAHQRGIAREDESNFIAFLICMESSDPYIRYSGLLNLYEYVISALYSANRELYTKTYTGLPAEIRAEEAAYSRFFEKYRENVVADISEATNNGYLQSQGSTQGTRSYGLVVDLAVAYYRPILG